MHRLWNHEGLFGEAEGSINFKAANGTKKTTGKLDVRGLKRFAASIQVAQVGAGSAGEFKLTLNGYIGEKGDTKGVTQVIKDHDLFTAVDSHPGSGSTGYRYLSFGEVTGAGAIGSATAAADLEKKLHALSFIELIVEVTTQADAATSCKGTMQLQAVD